ncbi:hypothetical protein BASA81_003612 [Batrachochytrium salamandrivorans]|nr:hypothetical protein BASA81_003612 [Batrachochytrium salamandrivorans]
MDHVYPDDDDEEVYPTTHTTPPILTALPPPSFFPSSASFLSTTSSASCNTATTGGGPVPAPSTLQFSLEKTDFNSFSRAQQRISSFGITNSEAHGEMFKERTRGCLYKRGFRFRKAWVARWVVLTGRMLRYYSSPKPDGDISHQRGAVELTADTVVSFEHFSLTGDQGEKKREEFGFVVFIRGIATESGPVPCFEEPFNLFFVMDLVLYGNLEQRIPMQSEREAGNVIFQIASALTALHDIGVVVVNLSPKQILFQNALTLKINDFGSAHHVTTSEFVTVTETGTGEPGYLAPELLIHKQVSKQCDLWTLGVLLAHLVTGIKPFPRNEDAKRSPGIRLGSKYSTACQELVAKLTLPNRTKRMQTAAEVLVHPFVCRKLFSFQSVARSVWGMIALMRKVVPAVSVPVVNEVAAAPVLFAQARPSGLGFIPKTKSYTEIRNEQWTMDALAKRARDEGLGSSESFMLSRKSTSNSFAAVGISSSVAGQLSEYGELLPVVSKPGPFMSALEDFLDDEAAGFGFGDDEDDGEEEDYGDGGGGSGLGLQFEDEEDRALRTSSSQEEEEEPPMVFANAAATTTAAAVQTRG